jgi:hypothetical protein
MEPSDAALAHQLFDALAAAQEQLEYCNWGDSWERECAFAAKLPEQIEAALEAYRKLYGPR